MGSTARQKKIGISVNTDRNKVGVIIRPSYKAEYVPKYVSEKTLNEFKEEVQSKYLTKKAAAELYGKTLLSEFENDMKYISYNEDGYFEVK